MDYFNLFDNEIEKYDSLCVRAISTLVTAFSIDHPTFPTIIEKHLSPIEQIFAVAYCSVAAAESGKIDTVGREKELSVPASIELSELDAQAQIFAGGEKYIADFLFTSSAINCAGVVIELDGYEYHSTKEQMNSDYHRERALQLAGYKVIRFTGSQVYRNPFRCAVEAVQIIKDCMVDGALHE